MRRTAEQLAVLPGIPFVLVVGLVAGTIQGTPRLLLGGTSAALKPVPIIIVGVAALFWWLGALLLWWIAVRRRSRTGIVAAQVTLGLVLGELFASALGMIALPNEFAAVLAKQFPTVLSSNLALALVRAPLWFVGSALAVAIGRHLHRGYELAPPPATPDTHPRAVI
ncbi:MAG TPA: hypothetical protein VGD77_17960 [Gemmatimonadaceae bacterium]